jgi:hypothetical protein
MKSNLTAGPAVYFPFQLFQARQFRAIPRLFSSASFNFRKNLASFSSVIIAMAKYPQNNGEMILVSKIQFVKFYKYIFTSLIINFIMHGFQSEHLFHT